MTAVSDSLRERAVAVIDENADAIVSLSKYIHANPEIAMQEFKSSKACADMLEHFGFTVERGVGDIPTAFAATYGTDGPLIAYLSEYDALPGLGHGCGHNLIAIANIAAGLGLKAAIDGGVSGRVTVFGTPAEEAVGGKVLMANAGLFAGVDAALGAHPSTSEASCPTVEGSGQALACMLVRIEYHGQSAHAAGDPWNGRNSLDAVIMLFNGISALRQHVKSDARLHGVITHGGLAPNVIPDYAAAEFFVRAGTSAYMHQLADRVREIAEGAAAMTGTRLDFSTPEEPNSDMITNHVMARALKKNLDRVGVVLQEAKAEPGSGSTDWGNVSYVTPSVELSYPIVDRVITWHSSDVVAAADSELGYENTLLVAKALAMTGIDLIEDPELLAEVKSSWSAEVARRSAVS
jgi:amidohydrolase